MNAYFTNQASPKIGARPELIAYHALQMPYYGVARSHLTDLVPPEQVIVHIGRIYPVRDWHLFCYGWRGWHQNASAKERTN